MSSFLLAVRAPLFRRQCATGHNALGAALRRSLPPGSGIVLLSEPRDRDACLWRTTLDGCLLGRWKILDIDPAKAERSVKRVTGIDRSRRRSTSGEASRTNGKAMTQDLPSVWQLLKKRKSFRRLMIAVRAGIFMCSPGARVSAKTSHSAKCLPCWPR